MNLINSLQLSWLSPEKIKKLSFGSITNHGVLDTRTFKPKLGGLFDPRVFGPFANYECYCGKYKGKKNKGQKCERCEVLITDKNIQRWRMGHIELNSPVTNVPLFKSLASKISKLLGITTKKLEDIIYFRAYIVIDQGLTNLLKKKEVLDKQFDPVIIISILEEMITDQENVNKVAKKYKENPDSIIAQAQKLKDALPRKTVEKETVNEQFIFWEDYLNFLKKYWGITIKTGSEAFLELLQTINLEQELEQIKTGRLAAKGNQDKIKFCQALLQTGIKLEWIVMRNLPLIPAGLRPVTKLKKEETGDKDIIATTQLNDFYRKIILANENVNYYLQTNEGVFFGEIVIHNAKRRLQKAVDQLFEAILQLLSTKDGILRLQCSGRRIDFSARAVIASDSSLSLSEIRLPASIAIIIFRDLVIHSLLKKKIAFTIKEAQELIKEAQEGLVDKSTGNKKNNPVLTELNEVCDKYWVMFNRAPSLHRLSIQAAKVKLTLSKAIGLHPLVTTALNADFDGDQIFVSALLTEEELQEAKEYMASSQQISDPKNGHLITIPNQDMILGIYYLTKETKSLPMRVYDEMTSMWKEYEQKKLNLHDLIILPAHLVERNFTNTKNQFLCTTLGKIIFNQILPASFAFYLNDLSEYNKKEDGYCAEITRMEELESQWEKISPRGGWKKKDVIAFLDKLAKITSREEMVEFLDRLKKVGFDYANYSGISISPFELGELVSKEKQLIQTEKIITQIEDYYAQGLYSEKEKKEKKIAAWQECKEELQKQLITNLEKKKNTSFYHIWDSGARISSENLTQLFAMRGHVVNYLGEVIETPIISSLWEGLTPFETFVLTHGMRKGMIDITLKTAEAGYLTRRLVEAAQEVIIRAKDCGTTNGILLTENNSASLAPKIYGRYLLQNIENQKKETILAANSLLGVQEMKVIQKNEVTAAWVYSPLTCELINGICQKCYGSDLSKNQTTIALGTAVGIIAAQSLGEPGTQLTMRTFHTGGIAGEEDIVQGLPRVKQILDNIQPEKKEKALLAKSAGVISLLEEKMIKQISEEKQEIIYPYEKEEKKVLVYEGEKVDKGDRLTTGKIDLEEYLEIMGREACQNYIKEGIKEVYDNQGIDINDKHIEIFARQMLSRVKIIEVGDSNYLTGDIVDYQTIQKNNKYLIKENKKPISFKPLIFSLKDLASSSSSFLASASFQSPLKTLVNYSLYQPVDYLQNPKASLIAGQLPPVGTGFFEREKYREGRKSTRKKYFID